MSYIESGFGESLQKISQKQREIGDGKKEFEKDGKKMIHPFLPREEEQIWILAF